MANQGNEIENQVLFVSHAAVDQELAASFKKAVELAVPGVDVFVSSDPEDLPIGDPWVERILQALGRAKMIIVLGTERSLDRKWVWFEAGAGWDRRRQIITACVGKLRKNSLPPPFQQHTARNLDDELDCKELFDLVSKTYELPKENFDIPTFCRDLVRLDVRVEERQRVVSSRAEDRPFQDAREKSLNEKLAKSDSTCRDLLRYLLVNGESDGSHVGAAAFFPDYIGSVLEFVEKSGLILSRIERAGHRETNRFWSINPEFKNRLETKLFPRPAEEGPPKFRSIG